MRKGARRWLVEENAEGNKPKNLGGRPPTGNYDIDKLVELLDTYTKETDIPILKEVCWQNNLCYEYLIRLGKENERLCQSMKRLLQKKETQLEKLALTGEVSAKMAVFSLKQLGWRDRQDIAIDTTDNRKQMDKYLEVVKNG